MAIVFYIFAAVLIYFSLKSFIGGIRYLEYFQKELARDPSEYTPFTTIIAPYKGLDEGSEENIAALFRQDHPAYEVIFVVDDENDEAVPLIRQILDQRSEGSLPTARLIIAPKTAVSGQKVENMREAVLHADPRCEVYAFVDSDARPDTDWLRSLVAPLSSEDIGAATGYRWFISEKPTFAGELRSAWNASIASALGANTESNFCWGGSMAMRKEFFDHIGMRDKWVGTLSDDFAVTKAVKGAGAKIWFVPKALTLTIEGCSLRECVEFTTRQMKITRVYAPHLWMLSFFGSALFTGLMLASLLIAIFAPTNNALVLAAIGTFAAVSLLSVGKAWLRMKAVQLRFPAEKNAIRRQRLPQLTLWLLAPPLFLFNCICALVSRRIVWRGTDYELVSAEETRIHSRR